MSRRLRALLLPVMVSLLLALSMSALLSSSRDAEAYSGISVSLDLPTYAGSSEQFKATLAISGGPAGDVGGNYSYKVEISEYVNKTGFAVTPDRATGPSGVFVLNLTMPGEGDQTIRVRVNATSKAYPSGDVEYTLKTFSIKVVDPIVIRAVVYNTGVIDALNVTAKFYADGSLQGSKTFNVSAGKSTELTFNWTFVKISEGKHVVSVVLDDPNRIAEFADGNNAFSQTIYVGDVGNPAGAVLTIGVIIMSVLVALTYLQKPSKRGKKA